GDRLAAAEAAMGQEVVEIGSLVADQMREHLALMPARQIGARRGRRQVELRGVARMLGHVSSSGLRSTTSASRHGGQPSMICLNPQYVRAGCAGWVRPKLLITTVPSTMS